MRKEVTQLLKILPIGCLLIYISGCATSTSAGKDTTHTIVLSDSTTFTYSLSELGDFYGPPITLDSSYHYLNKQYLHFIDGKRVEDDKKDKAFKQLRKKEIESVEIIPAEEALELYGEKAKDGAVIIRTKNKRG